MVNVYEADLSQFGYRELKEVAELLNKYLDSDITIDRLSVGFNNESGYVWLQDEDYNIYMLNGENLEQFFNCPECGHEGFKEEFEGRDCGECQRIHSPNNSNNNDIMIGMVDSE